MVCPLCERPIDNPSKHHLIPKSKKGKETVDLHRMCHETIHRNFTNTELAKKYNTIAKILKDEEIQKYIKWVQDKPIDMYIPVKSRRNKRR